MPVEMDTSESHISREWKSTFFNRGSDCLGYRISELVIPTYRVLMNTAQD